MKRLCLFAGFDKKNLIHDYVVYYIKSLSEISDVYYIADCEIEPKELNKISKYTKEAYAYRHEKYDFGSWQELINKIGWDKIAEYDELILCNDSCFGPVFPLEPIFNKMENENIDFWGLAQNEFQNHTHLQSYFLVFNKNVTSSNIFQDFINSIKQENNSNAVIANYELKLTNILADAGLMYDSYINPNQINFTISEMENGNNKDSTYYWKQLIKLKFPLIKVKIFTTLSFKKYIESLYNWQNFVSANSDYNTDLIKNYLKIYNLNHLGDYLYFIKRFFTLPQHDSNKFISLKNKIRLRIYNYLKTKLEEKNII